MTKGVASDVAGLCGLGLVGVGVWLKDPASSLIVVGAVLLVLGIWGALR